MDRRHFAALAGTAAALAMARGGLAQDGHAGHGGGHAARADGNYAALAAAGAHCVMAGQTCLRHCLETFAAGDTTLAACAKSVRELIAATTALQDLATAGSAYVPAMSGVVETICVGCERECRRHAPHHATCRACADACLKCAAACRQAAA